MTNTEIKTKNQPKKRAANIQVDKLRTFEGHPFKVLDDEDMGNLIESIRQQGILSPLIVRTVESADEYEVISGHRRSHAAVKAGLSEVPALIYPLGRNEAMIAVVDSNLHRERILPSEKAFAYKMKMDAMKAQGRRTDLREFFPKNFTQKQMTDTILKLLYDYNRKLERSRRSRNER